MYASVLFRLVTLLIFLMPFGQLTRLPFTSTTSIYLHDGVIGSAVLFWILSIFQSRTKQITTALTKPITTFVLVGVVSLLSALSVLPLAEVAISSLYLVRWSFYAALFFIIFKFTTLQKERLTVWLVISATAIGLLGLVQYAVYPDLRNLYYAGWDPHLNRIFSTFLDPNFAGAYLSLGLLLVLSKFKPSKAYIRQYGVFLFVLGSALLLTYSRSSYVAFFAGAFTLGILQRKVKYFLVLIVLFITILPFLPRAFGEGVRLTRSATIYSRLENWQEALAVFREHPVFGVGFNTYRYRRSMISSAPIPSHAAAGIDNSFLFILATSGLIGFAAYIWIWLSAIKAVMKSISIHRMIRLSMFAAVFVHALFVNTLFYPWIMLWMWIVLGATEKSTNE